jgi:hypothetical protein
MDGRRVGADAREHTRADSGRFLRLNGAIVAAAGNSGGLFAFIPPDTQFGMERSHEGWVVGARRRRDRPRLVGRHRIRSLTFSGSS